MKILVVNDDSIHAPGIALLAQAAMALGEVTVAAPARQCSAMSQQITLRDPIRVRQVDFPIPVKAAWQVAGTPADCVRVAVQALLVEKPDLILSGINAGWNAGYDIIHSGTLGAAFEAAMYGIPAIALSNAHGASLELPGLHLPRVLEMLTAQAPPRDGVWNVNFPGCAPEALKGIRTARTVAPVPLFREWYRRTENPDGSADLTVEGTMLTAADPVPAGSDLEAVLNGYIAVGPVKCTVL